MKYLLLLVFPMAVWAILPESEINQSVKQYKESNSSALLEKTFQNNSYYVIIATEEKLFLDDTLEEEKPFLKAQIKEILLEEFKKRYPKAHSFSISGLIHGQFWESNGFFHHIAQIQVDGVKPLYSTPAYPKTATDNIKPNPESFETNADEGRKALKARIDYLEIQQKKHPKNIKILEVLRELYSKIGDVDGFSSIDERIIEAKMDI